MCAGVVVASPQGTEWPQILGPKRDGVYRGGDVAMAWPSSGPTILWEKHVGEGFSAPVKSGGSVIVFYRSPTRAIVLAVQADTGDEIWKFDYETTYRDNYGRGDGPRATPTIADGRVFTFGPTGVLHALNLKTGKRLWRVDTQERFEIGRSFFGVSSSPLVEGELLLLNLGGQPKAGIVALDTKTGKTVWTATDHDASYSSPTAVTIGGERHALFLTRRGFVDIDPLSGRVRNELRWRAGRGKNHPSVNAAIPLVRDNLVFLSECYGPGAVLLRVGPQSVDQIWTKDRTLSNHYVTSVLHGDHLYGLDGRQEATPDLVCVEFTTGNELWRQRRFGTGSILLAGNDLLVTMESGELRRVAANSKSYKLLQTAKLLEPTVRALPALAGGKLYARDGNRLVCVDLRQQGKSSQQ